MDKIQIKRKEGSRKSLHGHLYLIISRGRRRVWKRPGKDSVTSAKPRFQKEGSYVIIFVVCMVKQQFSPRTILSP